MQNIKHCPVCTSEATIIERALIKEFHVCCNNRECQLYTGLKWVSSEEEAAHNWNINQTNSATVKIKYLGWRVKSNG